MWRPSSRSGGPLAVLGALCLLGAMLPLGIWPAPRPGDSYVFDPASFSAVWAQRVVVPALTVSANVLVLAGLYALYRRDGPAMPDWQRWTAQVTLLVALVWLFGTALVTSAGPNDFVSGVYGGLLAVLSLIVIVPGLVARGRGLSPERTGPTRRRPCRWPVVDGPLRRYFAVRRRLRPRWRTSACRTDGRNGGRR